MAPIIAMRFPSKDSGISDGGQNSTGEAGTSPETAAHANIESGETYMSELLNTTSP